MRLVAFLLALLLQAAPAAPLVSLRTTLRQVAEHLDEHRPTNGATAELTAAKHGLRDWIESELASQGQGVDARAFADTLHRAVRGADLLCDDCDVNLLGYLDDIRVSRQGDFLIIVTAVGINCGYDESGYAYAWDGQAWKRIWEHERNTYTLQDYLPQNIHDVQISAPDANGVRVLMMLGSQTVCGGAFKNLYARAWRVDGAYQLQPVLDWTGYGNDGYPPIDGRVAPGDVLFQFTAGAHIDADPHDPVRHFTIDRTGAVQVDPIAGRPHDFVVEWLAAPWDESRTRSESASLEAAHAELHPKNAVGDFPEPTLRCTAGDDLWQVTTHLYEGPKRYYRVRWRPPFTFTMVEISETPFPDCTVRDSRGDAYSNVLQSDLR